MNWKQAVLLLLVCLGCFSGYFFYPLLAYGDTYAFLSNVCGVEQTGGNLGSDLFFKFILPFIPCDFFLIKLVLLLLFVLNVFLVSKIGENVVGEGGWKAGLFAVTLSPLFLMEAIKFENDVFGWTLGFVGLWVFTLSFRTNNVKERVEYVFLGICALFFASFIWVPVVLIGFAVVLMCFWAALLVIPLSIPILLNLKAFLFQTMFGKNVVAEEMMGVGIVNVALLLPSLIDIPKKVRWGAWFLFICGLIASKYMILALPFLAIGVIELDKKMKKWRHWPNLVVICLIFVFVYAFLGFNAYPTQQDFGIMKEGVSIAKDNNVPLFNDWGVGWYITYLGYHTDFKASYPNPDYNNLVRPFVAVSSLDLNCLLKETGLKVKLFVCD